MGRCVVESGVSRLRKKGVASHFTLKSGHRSCPGSMDSLPRSGLELHQGRGSRSCPDWICQDPGLELHPDRGHRSCPVPMDSLPHSDLGAMTVDGTRNCPDWMGSSLDPDRTVTPSSWTRSFRVWTDSMSGPHGTQRAKSGVALMRASPIDASDPRCRRT